MSCADRTKTGEGFNNRDQKEGTKIEQQDLRLEMFSVNMYEPIHFWKILLDPKHQTAEILAIDRHIATPKKIEKQCIIVLYRRILLFNLFRGCYNSREPTVDLQPGLCHPSYPSCTRKTRLSQRM